MMGANKSSQQSKVVHVLLTGGVGSRLWPLSRKSQPKQYIELFNKKSLFQLTYERNAELADDLYVVGNIKNCHLSAEALKKDKVPYVDIIEATPRNTAAAIAFAAFEAQDEDVLVVTPSDHVVEGKEAYAKAMNDAISLARQGFIVTYGIQPTRPETGYGYIEYNNHDVVAFREKPNLETAKEFIAKGNFLWNSGMFCFQAGVFLEELKAFAPEVFEASKVAYEASVVKYKNNKRALDLDLSMKIPSISVDYAVMERSSKMKVVPANFEWSDLGSFESVYDYLVKTGYPVDANGNMVLGTDKHTEFVGLQDTIVVSTPEANLILSKSKSQDVKDVYARLEAEGSDLIE